MKLSIKSIIISGILSLSVSSVYSAPELYSSPVYSQKFVFNYNSDTTILPNFSSTAALCDDCEIKWGSPANGFHLNYSVPENASEEGTLVLLSSYYQGGTGTPKCNYITSLPFVISPNGDLKMNSGAYNSRLDAGRSQSDICNHILPVTIVATVADKIMFSYSYK